MQRMGASIMFVWLIFSLYGCATQGKSGQEVESSSWQHFTALPLNHAIFDAIFVSGAEGWAVGEQGVILHHQGGKWVPVEPAPTKNHLFSVAFPRPQEGWGVGAWGTILHYDGNEWKVWGIPEGFEANNFEKVVFTSPTDGWAIGDSAGIAHYDGKDWQRVAAPTMRFLRERQVKVEQYGLMIEAMREASFEEEAGYFHDLAFRSPQEGWIVGNSGQILHFDGQKWQEVASPTRKHLYALCLTPSGKGWAVGQEGTILYYNGKRWQKWPSSPTRRHLLSLNVVSENEVYAVGVGGVVLRYDGSDWRIVEGPRVKKIGSSFHKVIHRAEEIWVFSSTRAIFQRKRSILKNVPGK